MIDGKLERPAQVDRALWSIVARALATDPSERQPNSKSLSAELFGYLVLGTGTKPQDGATTQVTAGSPLPLAVDPSTRGSR
jgi:hypothetical protein